MLNFVTEDITFFADDLDAEVKRQLLAALLGSLSVTLPFLQHSLEGHFTQAAAAAQQGNQEGARAHSAVVSAALGEWDTWEQLLSTAQGARLARDQGGPCLPSAAIAQRQRAWARGALSSCHRCVGHIS